MRQYNIIEWIARDCGHSHVTGMISTNQAKIESFKEGIKIYVELLALFFGWRTQSSDWKKVGRVQHFFWQSILKNEHRYVYTHTHTHDLTKHRYMLSHWPKTCASTLYYNQLTPTLILLLKSWQAGHKPAALAIWQQATVPTRVVFEYITVN